MPEAQAVMLADTPIDRECRDKLRKLLLDWLEERRCLGVEESLAYKFQDALEMSLALFHFYRSWSRIARKLVLLCKWQALVKRKRKPPTTFRVTMGYFQD